MSATTDERPVAAVFDLDGTLVAGDALLAFLWFWLREHPERLVPALDLARAFAAFRLGLRDRAWLKATFLRRVLGGAPRAAVEESAERFARELATRRVRPRARAAIEVHRLAGARLVLATANIDLVAAPVARELGFDAMACTVTSWTETDRISGLAGPNLRGVAKLDAVRLLVGETGHVVAYADEADDVPLLEWADEAIAIDPTGALLTRARTAGWRIESW